MSLPGGVVMRQFSVVRAETDGKKEKKKKEKKKERSKNKCARHIANRIGWVGCVCVCVNLG